MSWANCCGSVRWVELMRAGGPYDSAEALLAASERAFDALGREDWLQAFAAHSRIGAVRRGDVTGAGEQVGVVGADPTVLDALVVANTEYERRFGFVFLIRARGRSARELLSALQARLHNPRAVEFATACEQQREITRLRLEELELVTT